LKYIKEQIVHYWGGVSKAMHPISRKTRFGSPSSSETWVYTFSWWHSSAKDWR